MDKRFFGHSFLLFLLALLLFGMGTGQSALWDIDEPNNAQALKEMISHGNYIVPTFNGQLRPDKPILNYWLMAGMTRIFGFNEWGLRAGAVLFGALLVWLIAVQTRRLFDAQTGLVAGLLAATALHSQIIFRAAVPDALLIFMVSLGLLSWLLGYLNPATRTRDYLLGYAAFGLGVLAKGPIAVLLPGLIVLLFLIWRRDLRHLRAARLPAGIALFLLIALPWYVWVGLDSHGTWIEQFLGTHNFGRFASSMEGHRGPIFYYLLVLFPALLPWSIFLPQALLLPWRRYRTSLAAAAPAHAFLLLWAVTWIVFFSLAATKLPNYIWPAYPPLFVLIAYRLTQAFRAQDPMARWGQSLSLAALALAGLALIVAGQRYLPKALPGLEPLGILGLPYLLGGMLGLIFVWRRRLAAAVASVTVAAVALTFLLMAWALPQLEYFKPARSFGQVIHELQHGQPYGLLSYHWFQPSYLFYAGHGAQHIHQLASLQALPALLGRYPVLYLAMPQQDLPQLYPLLGPQLRAQMLLREKDMYSGDTVLLIRVLR